MESMLLTVREVAAALAISRSRVFELIRRRELPAVYAGGPRSLRVRRADLESYVASLPDAGSAVA